mmetsp:Transcript_10915/g.19444  ORF Transcript_10915/g.19444 Transcript_10915/m.19444 type:complete len:228 (-) Transcript_10915:381-1064(-)
MPRRGLLHLRVRLVDLLLVVVLVGPRVLRLIRQALQHCIPRTPPLGPPRGLLRGGLAEQLLVHRRHLLLLAASGRGGLHDLTEGSGQALLLVGGPGLNNDVVLVGFDLLQGLDRLSRRGVQELGLWADGARLRTLGDQLVHGPYVGHYDFLRPRMLVQPVPAHELYWPVHLQTELRHGGVAEVLGVHCALLLHVGIGGVDRVLFVDGVHSRVSIFIGQAAEDICLGW